MAHLTYECCTEKGKALMQMLKIGNFSHSVASFLSCLEICGRLLYIVCFHLYLCHTINTYHVCIVIWVGYFNLLFPLISCKNRYTYLTDLSTCKFKLQAVFLFVTDMWSFTKLMTENHFHLELYISSVPMPLELMLTNLISFSVAAWVTGDNLASHFTMPINTLTPLWPLTPGKNISINQRLRHLESNHPDGVAS